MSEANAPEPVANTQSEGQAMEAARRQAVFIALLQARRFWRSTHEHPVSLQSLRGGRPD